MKRLPDTTLVVVMCGVQLLTMLSISVYAAQLTNLQNLWGLNNTQSGWIGASYFVGYTVCVPVLTSLTDRIDPKRIYIFGAFLLFMGCAGFGLFADNLNSALLFHAIAGAGLAGTYMPGLKALVDHIDDRLQSRASAAYTASFGFGAAFSYPFSDYLGQAFGWPVSFIGAGTAALFSAAIVGSLMPKAKPEHLNISDTNPLDFRPVLRNKAALGYSLGYAAHCWELFGLRTWVVAFLVFSAGRHGVEPTWLGPSIVAAVLTILGVPSSIFGNEFAIRWGRLRFITGVMAVSALVCATIGLSSAVSYELAVVFCLLHGMMVIMDSGSLTAGAVGNAEPGYRGATMALHSTLGFSGAILGPLVFGIVLDIGGSDNMMGWWLAFAHLGVVQILGLIILQLVRPPAVSGDRR
ncbi:MAG: MFS transporter [Methyloligellaceae bacterium]